MEYGLLARTKFRCALPMSNEDAWRAEKSRRFCAPKNRVTQRAGAYALAFAAFVAGFERAGVPVVVLRVGVAEPAPTFFAEHGCRHIARLVQTGDTFTGRFRLAGCIFPGLLCFHGDTLGWLFYSERDSRDRQVRIYATTSWWPRSWAKSSAVLPSFVCACRSASCSTRFLRISRWPLAAAVSTGE